MNRPEKGSSYEYFKTLNACVTNGLIKLYIEIKQTPRYVPEHTRNAILIKYLKPLVKEPKWAAIKSEIKIMVGSGRKQGSSLEEHLINLHKLSFEYLKNLSERLFELFSRIEKTHNLDSKLFNPDEEPIPNCVYALQDQLEKLTTNPGEMDTVDVYMMPTDTISLTSVINESGIFTCESMGIDKSVGMAHYRLKSTSNI